MTAALPPSPAAFRDLNEWARQFYEYYLGITQIGSKADPLPVQLPHRTGGVTERATTAGIMLYCPQSDEPIVSKDNAFVPVLTAPSYTSAEIADQSSEVNTINKFTGRIIYDSTNSTLVIANGADPTSTWSRLTVAATVTPV